MKNNKDKDWVTKQFQENHQATTLKERREVVESGFSFQGVVRKIGDLIERECGFSKRELVILTSDYKPNIVSFEFLNKNVALLAGLNLGEKVDVYFRIEGREWDGRVLNNLIGTRLDRICELGVNEKEEEEEKADVVKRWERSNDCGEIVVQILQ